MHLVELFYTFFRFSKHQVPAIATILGVSLYIFLCAVTRNLQWLLLPIEERNLLFGNIFAL